MKFTEHLASHLTPEWRTQYICYEELKTVLEKYCESLDAEIDVDGNLEFTTEFLMLCQRELTKANNFYSEKIAEAKRKFMSFMQDIDSYKDLHMTCTSPPEEAVAVEVISVGRSARKAIVKKLFKELKRKPVDLTKKEIKLFMSEFYYNLVLLQNFQSLNYTGFRKILKKHDKLLNSTTGKEWFLMNVDNTKISKCDLASKMIEEIENLFTEVVTDGDRSKAMKQLRVPAFKEETETSTVFSVGLLTGMFLVEIIVTIIASIFFTEVTVIESPAYHVYEYGAVVIFFINLASINVYAWRKKGVNHVLIFELDPRNHISPFQLMMVSLLFAVIWASDALFYVHCHKLSISEFFAAMILSPILLILLFNPLQFMFRDARIWVFYQMRMIFTAPLHSIRFSDFWLADQLTSMKILFSNLPFVICFYVQSFDMSHTNIFNRLEFNTTQDVSHHFKRCTDVSYILSPALAGIPYLIRAVQCLRRYYDQTEKMFIPHLANTGKYCISLVSQLIIYLFRYQPNNSVVITVVVFVNFSASIYKLAWDILMDWSLFDTNSKDLLWLREERVYSRKSYYFFALIQDIILRFSWIVYFMDSLLSKKNAILLNTALVFLEVYRRFIWNFFRLENEHLNNCGEFRAVRDISISVIKRSDPEVVE